MTRTAAPRPPQRNDTHRIDTLAVRKLFTKLSADWIIRDLSERDYGIDLMLEYYRRNDPTGQFVFFQVKGQTAPVEISAGLVKFQMKKHTLLYAELFPEPFFLVYTSIIPTEPVFYVWLQKYVSHVLDRDRPNWRIEETDTISVQFPETNTFETAQEKLIAISKRHVLLNQSLRFLSTFLFWELNYAELRNGNDNFIGPCLENLDEFKKLEALFEDFGMPDFKDLWDCIETYDMNDPDTERTLFEFDESLDLIKTAVLTPHHREQIDEEYSGEVPY